LIKLLPEQAEGLRSWFSPERSHLIGLHVLNTGNGSCFADRWPAARAVLAAIGSLCSLSGEAEAVDAEGVRERACGLLHCPAELAPVLEKAYPDLRRIERVVFELEGSPKWTTPAGVSLRRLEAEDAGKLKDLSPDLHWIGSTWGGLEGLSSSGFAWAAFIEGRLASLAATFLVADGVEDIGVVTESSFRGQGLAVSCAAALCGDIHSRGRCASWTTSADNTASVRAAEKLGFKFVRPDVLYAPG
jgi:hypothetical protein